MKIMQQRLKGFLHRSLAGCVTAFVSSINVMGSEYNLSRKYQVL